MDAQSRRQNAADEHGEHYRVAELSSGVELAKRIDHGAADDRRGEQGASFGWGGHEYLVGRGRVRRVSEGSYIPRLRVGLRTESVTGQSFADVPQLALAPAPARNSANRRAARFR